jgi:hypothetical protein
VEGGQAAVTRLLGEWLAHDYWFVCCVPDCVLCAWLCAVCCEWLMHGQLPHHY